MENYQIIQVLEHYNQLSPVLENLNVGLANDFYKNPKIFVAELKTYPATYSPKYYKSHWANTSQRIYFEMADVGFQPHTTDDISDDDFKYALVKISPNSNQNEPLSFQDDYSYSNVNVEFIKLIDEPALDYYVNYKINNQFVDTMKAPYFKLGFDFVSRRFTQEEFDSVLWPLVVKNKILCDTDPEYKTFVDDSFELPYSSYNFDYLMQILNSEFGSRIKIDLEYAKKNEDVSTLSFETFQKDLMRTKTQLSTKTFLIFFESLFSNNNRTDFDAFNLFNLIDFSEKENFSQFDEISEAKKIEIILILINMVNMTGGSFADIAKISLKSLAPFVKRLIHKSLQKINFKNDEYTELFQQYHDEKYKESHPSLPDIYSSKNEPFQATPFINAPTDIQPDMSPNELENDLDFDYLDSLEGLDYSFPENNNDDDKNGGGK